MNAIYELPARAAIAEDVIRIAKPGKAKAFREQYAGCRIDAVRVSRDEYLRSYLPRSADAEAIVAARLLFQNNRSSFESLFGEPTFRIQEDGEVFRVYLTDFLDERFVIASGPKTGTFYEWIGNPVEFRLARPILTRLLGRLEPMISSVSGEQVARMRMQLR